MLAAEAGDAAKMNRAAMKARTVLNAFLLDITLLLLEVGKCAECCMKPCVCLDPL